MASELTAQLNSSSIATDQAPAAKRKLFKWSFIWHPLAGFFASLGIAIYGLLLWVALNGGETAYKFIDANPAYALVIVDHIAFWLIGGTVAVLMLAHKKRKFRIGAYTMAVMLALALTGTFYVHRQINAQVLPAPVQINPRFVLDSRLAQLAVEVGINPDDLKRAKAQMGLPSNLTSQNPCAKSDVVGCFTDGTIYIYPQALEATREEQRATLAHEYLHWAWNTATPAEHERLSSYLNIFYGEHRAWFDQRTSTMIHADNHPGTAGFTDELHSFIGTEVDPKLLPPELNEWYDKWLTKRDSLPRDLK